MNMQNGVLQSRRFSTVLAHGLVLIGLLHNDELSRDLCHATTLMIRNSYSIHGYMHAWSSSVRINVRSLYVTGFEKTHLRCTIINI